MDEAHRQLPAGLWIRYRVDEHRRHVAAKSTSFDSALFARLVTSVLPEELGVVAYRDDNLGWVTPTAPYSLEVRFGGLRFKASVVKLMKLGSTDGGVATRLKFISSCGTYSSRSQGVS